MISRIFLAVVVALTVHGSARAQEPPTVTIAVRTDARPFAWQAANNPETFSGYLVDICIDATTRAGYHFKLVPIDAAKRSELLGGKFDLDNQTVDLLCDPTTITLARLKGLAANIKTRHAVFSPILFIANGSYVRRRTTVPCVVAASKGQEGWCEPIGKSDVEKHKLLNGSNCLVPEGQQVADAKKYLVAGFVRGSTARDVIERAVRTKRLKLNPDEKLCLFTAESHTKGVELLCGGMLHFYIGDIDIIEAYLSEQTPACNVDRAEAPLSYEPYALLVPSKKAAFRAKFVAAVYEIFADGTAAGRFAHHFKGLQMSTALSMLFRINSIPDYRTPPQKDDPQEQESCDPSR